MLDKIVRINSTTYMIIYTHRTPVIVSSEEGNVLHLVEGLLSPRHDMTYSEYLSLKDGMSEDTQEIKVA